MSQEVQLFMRAGVPPEQVVGKKVPPPPVRMDICENGLFLQRNVSVTLRDGTRIFVDIYRPDGAAGEADLPILLGWSPYGKHNTSARLAWLEADVAPGWISAYTAFEAPDPAYWCRRGYAVVYPDPRGTWYSEGESRHGGRGEAEDCYDLIEWLGQRPWSNGHVGMSGVSYRTAIQWQVAALRFFSALGMGGEWSLGVALVMEIWPDRSRAFMAGLIGAAANVGYLFVGVLTLGLGQVMGALPGWFACM